MNKLKIVTGKDNQILRAVSSPVKKFDASLKKFVRDMKETMFEANGLGIAAPQCGKNIRAFIVILDYKTDKERVLAMVNPVLSELSEEMEVAEEGCLSLPGKYGNVARHKSLKVEFFDAEGMKQVLRLSDLNARVVQHENDHIDGVLFIDKLVS